MSYNLGKKVKLLRIRRSLKQDDLTRVLNLSRGQISNLCKCQGQNLKKCQS